MNRIQKPIKIHFNQFNDWKIALQILKFFNKLSGLIYPILITLWMFLNLNIFLVVISAIIWIPHFSALTFINIKFKKLKFYKYIDELNLKELKNDHIIKNKKYSLEIRNKNYIFKQII